MQEPHITLEELLEFWKDSELDLIAEAMNFDQLFALSEPGRVMRSNTVRGPALDVDSFGDRVNYFFNFKSFPSTTGLRHRGYIQFKRPEREMTLDKIPCVVDCTCPDYKYRWAWANKQRGASQVGPRSANQAWNRAPRITNPTARPGICKHILALRDYIYGSFERFDVDGPEVSKKLDKLTRFATKRWINFPAEVSKAKGQEREWQAARRRWSAGTPPDDVEPSEQPELSPEELGDEDNLNPQNESVIRQMNLQATKKLVEELSDNIENSTPEMPENAGPENAGPEDEVLSLLRSINSNLEILAADAQPEPPPAEEGGEEEDAGDIDSFDLPEPEEA